MYVTLTCFPSLTCELEPCETSSSFPTAVTGLLQNSGAGLTQGQHTREQETEKAPEMTSGSESPFFKSIWSCCYPWPQTPLNHYNYLNKIKEKIRIAKKSFNCDRNMRYKLISASAVFTSSKHDFYLFFPSARLPIRHHRQHCKHFFLFSICSWHPLKWLLEACLWLLLLFKDAAVYILPLTVWHLRLLVPSPLWCFPAGRTGENV